MIPYFTLQTIPLGPLNLQAWGLFVALGIAVSLWIGHRYARRHGLDPSRFLDLGAWALIAGVVGSRLVYVLVYEPGYYWSDPLAAIRVWDGGLSWFGGVLGAALAMWLFAKRERLPLMPYLNAAAYALPFGYAIGRIGCFLIHDHIGVTVESCPACSVLAVDFPGAAKLDMGLIHSILGAVIGSVFLAIERQAKGRPRPYLFLLMLIYGASRFFLDFLRYWDAPFAETRYRKLTPAQYLSIPLATLGGWFLYRPPQPPSLWQRLTIGWRSRVRPVFDRLNLAGLRDRLRRR
jgi:phosphatidylglycerol:prolipoprotein diacylglycerol transferase